MQRHTENGKEKKHLVDIPFHLHVGIHEEITKLSFLTCRMTNEYVVFDHCVSIMPDVMLRN